MLHWLESNPLLTPQTNEPPLFPSVSLGRKRGFTVEGTWWDSLPSWTQVGSKDHGSLPSWKPEIVDTYIDIIQKKIYIYKYPLAGFSNLMFYHNSRRFAHHYFYINFHIPMLCCMNPWCHPANGGEHPMVETTPERGTALDRDVAKRKSICR